MKQNKQRGNMELYSILAFMLLVSLLQFIASTTRDIARLEKYDSCLTQAITINPDPNDTDIRSKILRECMDK